jgi:hypothetical protein
MHYTCRGNEPKILKMERLRIPTVAAILLASCIAGTGPAMAHHSNVAFDVETVKQITGTVKQFEWENPHIWITLLVADNGQAAQEWRIEGRPPGILIRSGWSRDSLHAGDTITIYYSPAKDGTRTGLVARVTLADGTVLANGPRAP